MEENKFEKMLNDHIHSENNRLDSLSNDIRVIKENHLTHIEAEMGRQGKDIASMLTNYSWIKWIVTTTLGAVLVGVIAAVMNLLTK